MRFFCLPEAEPLLRHAETWSKAAIAAGYAPKNAAVQATGLLRNPNIASAIAEGGAPCVAGEHRASLMDERLGSGRCPVLALCDVDVR